MKSMSFPVNTTRSCKFQDFKPDHPQEIVSSSDLLVFVEPVSFDHVPFG